MKRKRLGRENKAGVNLKPDLKRPNTDSITAPAVVDNGPVDLRNGEGAENEEEIRLPDEGALAATAESPRDLPVQSLVPQDGLFYDSGKSKKNPLVEKNESKDELLERIEAALIDLEEITGKKNALEIFSNHGGKERFLRSVASLLGNHEMIVNQKWGQRLVSVNMDVQRVVNIKHTNADFVTARLITDDEILNGAAELKSIAMEVKTWEAVHGSKDKSGEVNRGDKAETLSWIKSWFGKD